MSVDVPAKTVTLSKILMWYGADFAPKVTSRVKLSTKRPSDSLLTFTQLPKDDALALLRKLHSYLGAGSEAASDLGALLDGSEPGDIKLVFRDYDWTRNDA